jgi:hypothetical protein
MAGNVVEAIVGGLTYVVVSKAPYEELVGTTECITLYTRCRTNPGRYNWVQLWFTVEDRQ